MHNKCVLGVELENASTMITAMDIRAFSAWAIYRAGTSKGSVGSNPWPLLINSSFLDTGFMLGMPGCLTSYHQVCSDAMVGHIKGSCSLKLLHCISMLVCLCVWVDRVTQIG